MPDRRIRRRLLSLLILERGSERGQINLFRYFVAIWRLLSQLLWEIKRRPVFDHDALWMSLLNEAGHFQNEDEDGQVNQYRRDTDGGDLAVGSVCRGQTTQG